MSWSFQGVGTPAALKAAIDVEGAKATGQSKEEYDQAAAHLKGLLDAANDASAVHVEASGSASFVNGARTYAYISVSIKQLGRLYVEE